MLAQARSTYVTGGEGALRKLAEEQEFTHAFVFKSGELLAPPPPGDAATQAILAHARAYSYGFDASSGALVATGSGAYTLLRCLKDRDGLAVCIAIKTDDVTNVLRSALGLVARSVGLARVSLLAPDNQSRP